MKDRLRRMGMALPALGLLGVMLIVGCGGANGSSGPPTDSPASTGPPGSSTGLHTITIGNHTDLTGPASSAMVVVNLALDDVVKYYNEEQLIPGVHLEVLKYDGQLDPARDIAGYEWLRYRGADFIYTGLPNPPVTLKSRVEEDGVVLFAAAVNGESLSPTGNVFCIGIVPEIEAYTQLKWVAENDWDYETKGPAKIGGAGWTDDYSPQFFDAARAYCEAHPDQFEWLEGYLTNFSFAWDAEVQQLADVDYVIPPSAFTSFVKQYHDGRGQGKILTTDVQVAFLGMVRDGALWDELDGMLAMRSTRWWNERDRLSDLTNEILERYHPDAADGIRDRGSGYLGVTHAVMAVESVRRAVEEVGAEDFDEAALYRAVESLSIEVDGLERFSFGEGKRFATNYYGMYELRAEEQDLFRVVEDWHPVVYGP